MTSLYEFTAPETFRDSPTMSAAKAAADAKANYGKNPIIATVGDLFPKPTQAELDGWMASLKADAAKPENKGKPTYSLRPEEKVYGYSETIGLPSFCSAAAEYFTKDTGIAAEAKNVIPGNGGKGALKGALGIFQSGDVVIVAAPGWPTNYDLFRPGVKIVEIATKDGVMRAADLEAALKKYPNPAAILINAPSNPTGGSYAKGEREAFFDVVAKQTKDTIVLSDDPYGKLVFDRPAAESIHALQRGPNEKKLFEEKRVACFRTVSKEYGLAGLRVGYVITKNERMLTELKRWNENCGGVGSEDQLKAQAAIMYGNGFITRTVEELTKKRTILHEGINKLATAHMDAPGGSIYGWVDFSGLKGTTVPASASETGEAYSINSAADAMRYLVNVAEVCGVPGGPFFAPNSPAAASDWHARITFSITEKELTQLVANLTQAEKKLEGVAPSKKTA